MKNLNYIHFLISIKDVNSGFNIDPEEIEEATEQDLISIAENEAEYENYDVPLCMYLSLKEASNRSMTKERRKSLEHQYREKRWRENENYQSEKLTHGRNI